MSMIQEMIDHLDELTPEELARLQAAIQSLMGRMSELEAPDGEPISEVVEYRAHEDGELQAEVRRYRRKDGTTSESGPYWYFKYKEGGRRKSIYLGKTDDPEGALAAKRGSR